MHRLALVVFLVLPVYSLSQVSEVWASYPSFKSTARDMILDEDGNIYVTGCRDSAFFLDILTIKYDNNGIQKWQSIHNDSLNGYAVGNSIAIDTSGNIYVTGYNCDSVGFDDIMTIKYDSSGNELWARRFNGSANSHDEAFDIAVSKSGNVYTTGYVNGPSGYKDIIIVKYDAFGNQDWFQQVNGILDSSDSGKSITLDSDENILIVADLKDSIGVSPILIAKYNSSGNNIWTSKYYGQFGRGGIARSVTTDNNRNVYITGSLLTNGWQDLIILKLDSSGNILWDYSYDGTGNQYDMGHSIEVDSLGNSYVVGDSDGGPASMMDYITIKLDSNGNQQWAERYVGSNAYDYGHDISIDNSGNVFVTGESYYGANFIPGFSTVKYDSSGNFKWEVRDTSSGFALKIDTDDLNNVYVFGSNVRNSSYLHFTTIKYFDMPTAITEHNQDKNVLITIAPNPSNGVFKINSIKNILSIKIYSIIGRVVYQSHQMQNIDLTNQPKGIYYCEIGLEEGYHGISKIVIQ